MLCLKVHVRFVSLLSPQHGFVTTATCTSGGGGGKMSEGLITTGS